MTPTARVGLAGRVAGGGQERAAGQLVAAQIGGPRSNSHCWAASRPSRAAGTLQCIHFGFLFHLETLEPRHKTLSPLLPTSGLEAAARPSLLCLFRALSSQQRPPSIVPAAVRSTLAPPRSCLTFLVPDSLPDCPSPSIPRAAQPAQTMLPLNHALTQPGTRPHAHTPSRLPSEKPAGFISGLLAARLQSPSARELQQEH